MLSQLLPSRPGTLIRGACYLVAAFNLREAFPSLLAIIKDDEYSQHLRHHERIEASYYRQYSGPKQLGALETVIKLFESYPDLRAEEPALLEALTSYTKYRLRTLDCNGYFASNFGTIVRLFPPANILSAEVARRGRKTPISKTSTTSKAKEPVEPPKERVEGSILDTLF